MTSFVKKYKAALLICLIIISSFVAVLPLTQKGFFTTDDGEWMIIRFSAFHQALRDGEFPVRLLGRLNQEYGYPVANFLYPGYMYLSEPLHILGFGFVDSIKILLALSMVLSGIFIYLWLRKFFDNFASFIGALFYIYAPYHLYDLYKRGSVGEVLALTIVPFIFWQLERKSIAFSALGIAFLIVSHNTLAVMFLGVIICYLLLDMYGKKKKGDLYKYLPMLLLGLGISAFFWLPALFELKYTVFSKTTISNWKEYFAPYTLIGYSTFVVLILNIIMLFLKKVKSKKHSLTILFLILSVQSALMSTSISSAIWNILPANFIQFPFRFLSITILCTAFLAALFIDVCKNYKKPLLGISLLIILFLSSLSFLQPSSHFNKGEGFYATNMSTTTVMDEYMPVWAKDKPQTNPEKQIEISKGAGVIQQIVYNNKKIIFTADMKTNSTIRINRVYWPGWKAMVDNKITNINYHNSKGLMDIQIPMGNHTILFKFTETPLRLFADLLSIASLIILFLTPVYFKVLKR